MIRRLQAKPKSLAVSVVIIGGGVMGCAAAYELGRRGVKVTVLERSVPGAEASSAAAGILGAQVESHHPGPLTHLGLLSRKLYPALVKDLERVSGISIGYRRPPARVTAPPLATTALCGSAEPAATWRDFARPAHGRSARRRRARTPP